jgi:hypothetical protein
MSIWSILFRSRRNERRPTSPDPAQPLASWPKDSLTFRAGRPSTEVYKHVIEKNFLLLRNAPVAFGAYTPYGDFVHVNTDDIRHKGLDMILADLQEFQSRDPAHGSVVTGLKPEEERARDFLKDYDRVSVLLHPEPLIELSAVDGGVFRQHDMVVVRPPCSNEAFFQRLEEAFHMCCLLRTGGYRPFCSSTCARKAGTAVSRGQVSPQGLVQMMDGGECPICGKVIPTVCGSS